MEIPDSLRYYYSTSKEQLDKEIKHLNEIDDGTLEYMLKEHNARIEMVRKLLTTE